jgi:hypothetical protein
MLQALTSPFETWVVLKNHYLDTTTATRPLFDLLQIKVLGSGLVEAQSPLNLICKRSILNRPRLNDSVFNDSVVHDSV